MAHACILLLVDLSTKSQSCPQTDGQTDTRTQGILYILSYAMTALADKNSEHVECKLLSPVSSSTGLHCHTVLDPCSCFSQINLLNSEHNHL